VIKKENTDVRRLEGRAAQSLAEHRDQIQAYEDLADEIGTEPGVLGLACSSPDPRSPHRSSAREPATSSTAPCLP
jgi:hypothetical protein